MNDEDLSAAFLDINQQFLEAMEKQGWKPHGIEISTTVADDGTFTGTYVIKARYYVNGEWVAVDKKPSAISLNISPVDKQLQ